MRTKGDEQSNSAKAFTNRSCFFTFVHDLAYLMHIRIPKGSAAIVHFKEFRWTEHLGILAVILH